MSAENRRRFVIAYGIQDDRRRNRIAKKLQSYGDRVQYSVFLVDARPAKLIRLRDALEMLIKPSEDSIYIFDLGVQSSEPLDKNMHVLGRMATITSNQALIV